VFALITDPTFQKQVCERTRPLSYDVDVHTVDGDTFVRVRSEISASELPRLAADWSAGRFS
jgi:hypothetical protein